MPNTNLQSSSGTVQFSYSFVHRPRPPSLTYKADEVFHTRQLLYPILITVYQTLICSGLEIVPYWTSETIGIEKGFSDDDAARRSLLSGSTENPDDWCLLTLDVRNVYSVPFEVIFERLQEGILHSLF